MIENTHNLPTNPSSRVVLSTAVMAAAAAAPASGAITHFIPESPLTLPYGSSELFFSLTTGSVSQATTGDEEYRLFYSDGLTVKPKIMGFGGNHISITPYGYATYFAEGATIGSETTPYQGVVVDINFLHSAYSDWASGTRGFMGLIVDAGTDPKYGWAEIEFETNNTLTLYGFAYEDSGAPITAGAVPEPATVGLLAALAAGSAAVYARRRKTVATDARG